MLTFLRKIRLRLLSQASSDDVRRSLINSGNIRKYILYAIGEIALVVIGILIALQINNWNEDRKDREKGQQYIREIYRDLAQDLNNIDKIIVQLELQYESSLRLINISSDLNIEIHDSIDISLDFSICSRVVMMDRIENTWDKLKSSGQLEMIEDDTLIQQLLHFYSFYDSRATNFNKAPNEVRTEMRKVGGRAYQVEDINALHESFIRQHEGSMTNEALLSESDSEEYISLMLADESLPYILKRVFRSSLNNILWFRGIKDQAQSILSYIEENYAFFLYKE